MKGKVERKLEERKGAGRRGGGGKAIFFLVI
jgi:hypothetical protein